MDCVISGTAVSESCTTTAAAQQTRQLGRLSPDIMRCGGNLRHGRTSPRRRLDTHADCLAQPAVVPCAHSRACERAAEPVFRARRPGTEAGHIVRIRPALVAGRCRDPVDHETASRGNFRIQGRRVKLS